MKWFPVDASFAHPASPSRANARQWVATGFTASRAFLAPVLLWPSIDPVFAFYWFVGLALVDAFDGMVARKLKVQSEFGKALDSVCDGVLIFCSVMGYTLRHGDPAGFFAGIVLPLVVPALIMYAVRYAKPGSALGSFFGTLQISYYFGCLFVALYLYGLLAHPEHPDMVTAAGVVLLLFFAWLKKHRAAERAENLVRANA